MNDALLVALATLVAGAVLITGSAVWLDRRQDSE